MSPAQYERCIRREAARRARGKTVQQLKAELGLDRTVRGHSHWLRAKIVELWIEMITAKVPVPVRSQRFLFDR